MALASLANRPKLTQKDAAIERSLPGQVTGRLKRAIDAMVWDGLARAEAAAKAPMSEHSLYVALTRPHVREYYKKQLDVLRLSSHARNIHVLEEIRDGKTSQMARVQAIKALEQLCDDMPAIGGGHQMPGLTIRIIGAIERPMIDVTPIKSENVEGT